MGFRNRRGCSLSRRNSVERFAVLHSVSIDSLVGEFLGTHCTDCIFNMTSGHGSCETGDCNGSFGCRKLGTSPITIAEFAPYSTSTLRYHVSLLKGFNVSMGFSTDNTTTIPICKSVGCPCDATQRCPEALNFNVKNQKIGCFSPCDLLKDDRFCCRGNFTDAACQANEYSEYFQDTCKDAVTYPNDFNNTRITCSTSSSYIITFCPDETIPSLRVAAI
ncbi:hypothetical protein SELMODRAFT_118249 [Selaginella moellendorffii]|uniref:Thaumatin-like protein n=1 Tax=Selaginella moellendorffii TaxID=88036 RepID=D8SJM9_SELML|nr:hypothetical protein SELMODRAFT_118249 [Selaginella moellendorffii]